MRSLSTAALNSAFAEQTDEVWLTLLTISHPSLTEPLRCVNNIENVVSNGYTYTAVPFFVELPTENSETPGEARLRIDNIDRAIVQVIREIAEPPSVSIAVVLASQPDIEEVRIDGLVLKNVGYDVGTVQGALSFDELAVEPICELITPDRFPGLY